MQYVNFLLRQGTPVYFNGRLREVQGSQVGNK